MRLLIVEDNPTVRRVIKTIVSDLANEIYECEYGAEAVAMYPAHQPDDVLMDIALGEMNGITLTSHIKQRIHRIDTRHIEHHQASVWTGGLISAPRNSY